MDLEKNSKLHPEVCHVNLKSTLNKVYLAEFTNIYGTPSSIQFKKHGKNTSNGILYTYQVGLLYPGLKEDDFLNFHNLLKDRYQLQIQFLSGDVYTLNTALYPFELSYQFIKGKGFQLLFKGSTPFVQNFEHNTQINGLPYRLTFSL